MDNINKLIVETVGTFFFLSVILHSAHDKTIGAFGIAAALLAAIYLGGSISGGHYNPAVTFVMMFENKVTIPLGIFYILSQLLGAMGAFLFNHIILDYNEYNKN
jgi:aquaporin Z